MNFKWYQVFGFLVWLSFGAACSKEASQTRSADSQPALEGREPRVEQSQRTKSEPPDSARVLATNVTSDRAEAVLATPVYNLTPQHRDALLAFYRREKELTNKLAATIALGFVGDEETVREFTNTLMHFSANRPLNAAEQSTMFQTVQALGFLAKNHDSAFEFLVRAMDPGFWKLEVPWRTKDEDYAYTVFAGRALWGLGASQRAEITEIFERIKQQPAVPSSQGGNWPPLTSALVDAVFIQHLLKEKGLDYFKRIYRTEQAMDEYITWLETSAGKEWRAWAKQWPKEHPQASGMRQPQ